MLKQHLDALRAAVAAASELPVHKSALVDANNVFQRSNYVIVFGRKPSVTSERYSKVARIGDRLDFDVGFKVVATTADSVESALERMESLDGLSLDVAGRSCSPLVVDSDVVLIDTAVKPGLFFADGSIRFTSRPS